MGKTIAIVGGVCVMAFCVFPMMLGLLMLVINPPQTTTPQPQAVQPVQAQPVQPSLPGYDPSKKEQRAEVVKKWMADGIVSEVRGNGIAGHAVVGPKFLAGKFSDKKAIAGVLLAYCVDQIPSVTFCVIHDQNNKRVGEVSATGLKLD